MRTWPAALLVALATAVAAGVAGAASLERPAPATPVAAPLPALDARVTSVSVQVTHAGVTEERRFQERLVRRGDTLWRERVLPAVAEQAAHAHAHVGGHEHFDYEAAALWATTAGREQTLRFVDRDERVVVEVPAAEFETVGYDGSWVGAAALVSPDFVARLPVSRRASPVAGAVWHEQMRDGWYNRVLWSPAQQIALRVETGREDGTLTRRTSVELLPPTAESALPWRALQGYEQKQYADYLD